MLRKPNGEYDIQLFPVHIRKSHPLTKVLSFSNNEEKKENEKEMKEMKEERMKKKDGILALVGDASVTAHYRLGIGINNV